MLSLCNLYPHGLLHFPLFFLSEIFIVWLLELPDWFSNTFIFLLLSFCIFFCTLLGTFLTLSFMIFISVHLFHFRSFIFQIFISALLVLIFKYFFLFYKCFLFWQSVCCFMNANFSCLKLLKIACFKCFLSLCIVPISDFFLYVWFGGLYFILDCFLIYLMIVRSFLILRNGAIAMINEVLF